ncbi:MAG: hypothetical protein ACI4S0_12480 [Dorea sp.]
MVKQRIFYLKDKLSGMEINTEIQSCLLGSLDGLMIGFGGRYLINRIEENYDGVTAAVLQGAVLFTVPVLAGITGYFADRGIHQKKEKVWAGI